MLIHHNTTGMPAALTVATDKEGREHCVVVVKGTFRVGADGAARLGGEQAPLVASDVHHGEPGASSVRYECEFVLEKPGADVIVNGQAHAPGGKPVSELTVSLEIGAARKDVRVVGDRRWERGLLGFRATEPAPFVTMPLVYERTFGGSDHSHPQPKHQGTERRNTVGAGFHRNSDPATIEGLPLPNLEHPQHRLRSWSDTPPPVGFGATCRNWLPRLGHAGTYDQRWLEERFPFLPDDFDTRHFLGAPIDQQVPELRGGEVVRCLNMSAGGTFALTVPRSGVSIVFRFRDRDVEARPVLDTLIVEPDLNRVLAVWRARVALGRKLHALREVVVGAAPVSKPAPAGKGA
jgi:hypothetical protein